MVNKIENKKYDPKQKLKNKTNSCLTDNESKIKSFKQK